MTVHEWLDLLEKQAEVRPGITDRILTDAKQMLKWGVKRRLIPANPLSDISARQDLQIKKRAEFRSLSDDEIARVWGAIERSRMAAKNRLFLKLCLIYGCRNGELRLAKKDHFDFDRKVWTVPPSNHKLGKTTGKPLLRPIVPATEVLLREAVGLSGRGKHLFTNNGSTAPMGTSAPLALPYNVMQWLRRHEEYEMEHRSVHDLRKTARTNFSTLTEPHIAEIMLGHRLPGAWQVRRLTKDRVQFADRLALQFFNRRDVVVHVVLLGWRPPSATFQRRRRRDAANTEAPARAATPEEERVMRLLASLVVRKPSEKAAGRYPRKVTAGPHTGV